MLYSCNQCTRPFCAVLPDGSLGCFHTPGAIAFSTELCASHGFRAVVPPSFRCVSLFVARSFLSLHPHWQLFLTLWDGRLSTRSTAFCPVWHPPLPPIAHPVIMSSMHYFGCAESLFHGFPCLSAFVCERQAHSLLLNEVPLLSRTCFPSPSTLFLFVVIGTLPFSQQGISPPSSFFAIAFRIQGCQCEQKNEMIWCAN